MHLNYRGATCIYILNSSVFSFLAVLSGSQQMFYCENAIQFQKQQHRDHVLFSVTCAHFLSVPIDIPLVISQPNYCNSFLISSLSGLTGFHAVFSLLQCTSQSRNMRPYRMTLLLLKCKGCFLPPYLQDCYNLCMKCPLSFLDQPS